MTDRPWTSEAEIIADAVARGVIPSIDGIEPELTLENLDRMFDLVAGGRYGEALGYAAVLFPNRSDG